MTQHNGRPTVLLTGKLPPPYIGPSVATTVLLESALTEQFEVVHFDTSDHRDIRTLAALDFQNFYLAFRHYARLFRLVRRHRPDLVYIPAGQSTIGYLRDAGFIWIASLSGSRVVCHLRGGYFRSWVSHASALTRWLVRKTHARVDGQIVLGHNLRPLFDGYVPWDRTYVVPNGGDYPNPLPNGRSTKKVRVLFLSNLHATKGVMETIDAAAELRNDRLEVEFVFAGSWRDDAFRREVETRLKRESDLPVRFVGSVTGEEKFRLLSSSDIFVLPTYYPNEGHPWAIVEAMSAGLPILSTDHAAIPESVHDGVNGYLVPKRDPVNLAERIRELASDADLRQRMAAASRRIYEEGFTEERMVRRMSAAFHDVLHRPRRTSQAEGNTA